MEIPVGIYSRTTRVSFPQLKKQSKMAAAIPEESRKTDKVIMDRTYYATDDKEGEEVKKEDRVKGYKYGQNIVPMSEYDEAALSYSCERTLTTLGFAAASSITPESSMHTVDTVAADKGDAWAHYAFESLVEAMLAEQRVLIARYVYRKDSQPHMVALIPKKGVGSASHMVLQFLPFEEDVRPWTCASLPESTSDQRAAMAKIVDGLTLCSKDAEMLRPEETSNPSLTRFYDFLASRAVKPGTPLPPASAELGETILAPPAAALAQLDKVFPENDRGQLKTLFGLEKVEKAVGKGGAKRFWREAIAEKSKNSAAFLGEVDTKKIKVDAFTGVKKSEKKDEEEDRANRVKAEDSQDQGPGGMAVAVGPPPRVHIGSVHPERDFERWLGERRTGGVDVVGPAIEQMCDVILRFAEEGEEFHGKALSCMATLRRGCVREGEAASYNEFARKIRLRMTKRLGQLWERVVKDGGLGLITDAEVVTSTVTAADAKAFLEGALHGMSKICSLRPGNSLCRWTFRDCYSAARRLRIVQSRERDIEDRGMTALHWKLPEDLLKNTSSQKLREEAELDLAEDRLRLGEACLADALNLVVPVDDGQAQLAEVVEELERQRASLEAAEAARDSLQDEASDLLLLLHAAESRSAELEKKLTASAPSRAALALEALRESGLTGAAALVVVLARLCGGPRLAFLAIDANNSGAVSTYEFDSALRFRLGLDYEAITGLKLRSLFKEFDTRHCGLVYGVDMVSAFAQVWRRYGIPEEVARDPLLNPDLEGPAHDEVLREQQRWLRETRRPASPRSARSRQRSSSPQGSPTELRTPRSDILHQKASVSPRIRDEWDRGYRTVGIPVSPRSPRALELPGVSARSRRPDTVPPLQMGASTASRPERSPVRANPRQASSAATAPLSRPANTAGVMADGSLAASKQSRTLMSSAGGAARVRSTSSSGHSEPQVSKRSPNRAGAMPEGAGAPRPATKDVTGMAPGVTPPGPPASTLKHPPASTAGAMAAPQSAPGTNQRSMRDGAHRTADAQRPQALSPAPRAASSSKSGSGAAGAPPAQMPRGA
ncbi:ku80, partial [Symbiodinium natans]